MTSILVAICAYFISCAHGDPHAWGDFKTALLACGMVLAGFAIYHLIRTPWLVHRDASAGTKPLGKPYVAFGILVALGLVAGVAWVTIFVVHIAGKNSEIQSANINTTPSQSSDHTATPSRQIDSTQATVANKPPSSSPAQHENPAKVTGTKRVQLSRRVPQLIGEFQLKFPDSASDVNQATRWANAQLEREGIHARIVIDRLPPVEKSQTTINVPPVVYFRDCNNCSAQTGDVQYNINVDGKPPVRIQPTQSDPTTPQP